MLISYVDRCFFFPIKIGGKSGALQMKTIYQTSRLHVSYQFVFGKTELEREGYFRFWWWMYVCDSFQSSLSKALSKYKF